MRPLGLLLCLVTVPQGVLSQDHLKQCGPGQVNPSQKLSVTCADYNVSITTNCYLWNWIRQKPAMGLQWMGRTDYDRDTYYSPALKSRTPISRDTSKNQFSLQLSSVATKDTAVYYCVRHSEGKSV